MKPTYPRALRCLSQTLLVYLLGLHLFGGVLHHHPNAPLRADDPASSDATVISDDACLLCDWLVQPLLIPDPPALTGELASLPEAPNVAAPANRLVVWTGWSGGSRAPPFFV